MTMTNSITDIGDASGSKNEKLVFNIAFAAMVAATLVMYVTVTMDPNELRWLWIMGLAGLSLLQMSSRAYLLEKISFDRTELFLVGFVAYAVLSLAWSSDYLAGLALLGKLGLLAAIFLCLKNAGNDEWFNWLCGAITVAVALVFVIEFLHVAGPAGTSWGGYGNQNFMAEFLMLAVPFIAALVFIHRHKAVRAAALAVLIVNLGYLLFFNPSKIKFLIIAGFAIAAIIKWGWRHSRRLTLAGVFAVVVVTAVSVSYYWQASHGFRWSTFARIPPVINSVVMWLSQPFYGLGAGSYNYVYPMFQERHLEWLDVGTEVFLIKERVIGAAHNEYVQLLATFGLFGTALVAGFAYSLLRMLKGRPMTVYTKCGLASLGIWLLNALVEFPLQNPATALLAVIGLGFLAHRRQPDEPAGSGDTGNVGVFALNLNPIAKMLLLLGAIALVGAIGYGGYRFASAHQLYKQAVAQLNTRTDIAFANNLEAYRLYPWDTGIRNQLFVTTIRWSELNGGKMPFPPAEMDRIFDISMSSGPSTLLLLARSQYLLNTRLFQKEQRYAQEVAQWFDLLRKNASRTPDALLLDGYYQITLNNPAGAEALFNKVEKFTLTDGQKQLLGKLRAALSQKTNPNPQPQQKSPQLKSK